MKKVRIGILAAGSLTAFRLKTLAPILADKSFMIEFALIDARPRRTLLQKLSKNIKRGRGGYVLVMAFKNFFSVREAQADTEGYCKEHGIAVHHIRRLHAPETVDLIQRYRPDILLLVGGYGIIREPILSLAPSGVLSYHHGDMRKYRGMPPAFWEIYHGEKEMGVTVQILSSGLDNGTPVSERRIEIGRKESLKVVFDRAMAQSEPMMYEALKKLQDPGFTPHKIEHFGKVFTLPNLRQWLLFQARSFFRRLF